MGLFQRRRKEHAHDTNVRRETVLALEDHRRSLKKVRATLKVADETLADEIRRLDAAIDHRDAPGV